MRRVMMIAFVMLSLWLLVAPGFTAQGPASDQVASAERTIKDAGATATREVTDSWLTLQAKLALFADERVNSGDVHVTTQGNVITLRGKVDSVAEQQAAEEVARTIEGARDVSNQLTVVPQAERKAVDRQDDQIVAVRVFRRELPSAAGIPGVGNGPCAHRRGLVFALSAVASPPYRHLPAQISG